MFMKPDGAATAKKPTIRKKVGRFLLAALLAFLVLEAFSRIYFNKPIHHATPGGPTDYVWEPHTFYSVWTEGIGWGRTNNEGFYDRTDWNGDGCVDVLVMGSSFMMAEQVPQKYSTAALLQERLPQYRVYNIGMAAHGLLSCFQNLEAACEKYHPRYIVLDSQVLTFTDGELQLCLDDHGGLFSPPELQPLFPKKAAESEKTSEPAEAAESADTPVEHDVDRRALLRKVLTHAAETAEKTGTEIIVVFQPKTWLDGYGGILIYDDSVVGDYDVFYESCGVHLLNMSDIFRTNYESEKVLPFGFCNTKVGAGHLNRNGHRMIADALTERIGALEA